MTETETDVLAVDSHSIADDFRIGGYGMDERRTSLRVPVTFRASFAPTLVGEAEGTIVDLAIRGCRIESSTHVPVTTYLELRLQVSLQDLPILVDLAAVRWARADQLGIEFLSVRPEHQTRIERLIERPSLD